MSRLLERSEVADFCATVLRQRCGVSVHTSRAFGVILAESLLANDASVVLMYDDPPLDELLLRTAARATLRSADHRLHRAQRERGDSRMACTMPLLRIDVTCDGVEMTDFSQKMRRVRGRTVRDVFHEMGAMLGAT